MAENKKITQLNSLSIAASNDVFAIADISAVETKKITKLALMANPGPIGGTTPDTAVFTSLTLTNLVNEFSTDGTFSANSDLKVPTEKAIRSYVDNAVSNYNRTVRNINVDTTANIGEILLVNTSSGDINIELVPSTEVGKILIYKKNPPDSNVITITAQSGLIDGSSSSKEIIYEASSLEFLCYSNNFYTI